MPKKLPPELQASTDETGYSLLFSKGKHQWVVHLWSNQVMTCVVRNAQPLEFDGELTYKFVLPDDAKLEKKGFYAHGVRSAEQRRRAVAEYTRQIGARSKEGYELVADSRVLERAARSRAKRRILTPAQIAKLSPWDALKYCGTLYGAAADARVEKVASQCESTSEPEVRFAALRKLPPTKDLVTLGGSVTNKAFKGPYLWVRGDLHVKGHLELGIDLFVSGDLTVDGLIRDTREWTHLLVGGNVKAGALAVGSQLYAGGKVDAKLVVIDGTGELVAGKGLRARLLVEEGHDHRVKATLRVTDRVDFAKARKRGVATLEKVLAPKLAATVRRDFAAHGDDFYFQKKIVTDALKAGAPVWR